MQFLISGDLISEKLVYGSHYFVKAISDLRGPD
jgi:hypothetical protein